MELPDTKDLQVSLCVVSVESSSLIHNVFIRECLFIYLFIYCSVCCFPR